MKVGELMKISFFIGSMRRGGAERVISILANHYASKGWDVEIALLLENTVGYDLNHKIKIVDLTCVGNSYIDNLPKWLVKIRKYIKKSKPDRIVSFIGRINVLVLNACIGLKVPIIVSERNDPKRDGRSALMLKICEVSYKKAKAIVFQTKYQQTCFSRKLHSKSHVIVNPVTVNSIISSPSEERVVTAGRLLPQKNQQMMIKAIGKLRTQFPNIKLDIYGDGSLKQELQNLIEQLDLAANVQLHGNVMDLHEKIASGTVFVMTSEFEGLPNALIEAMMLGLPCISTDYDGVEEVIENNRTGILIPCNDVDALVEAITRILSDRLYADLLKTNALKTTKKYKQEYVLKEWQEVIER